jgi:hypothetical protein
MDQQTSVTYGLPNNAMSKLDYIVSNDRLISEQ